jgi:uncharacterized membrane protein YphA (DoxX/SURF4 family)
MPRYLRLGLGVSLFAFGFLKFFPPFKDWYGQQILHSGLPELAYPFGIAMELLIGCLYIFQPRWQKWASLLTMATMLVACYVHLQPEVLAEVLPLKIKAPFIPLMFFAAAAVGLRRVEA